MTVIRVQPVLKDLRARAVQMGTGDETGSQDLLGLQDPQVHREMVLGMMLLT